MSKRKLNVRLLRRIQRYIMEEPRRFFMAGYAIKAETQEDWDKQRRDYILDSDISKTMPPCGTAACIAGTANLLTGGRNLSSDARAAKLIGVESIAQWNRSHISDYFYQASPEHSLFIVGGWPEPFRSRYDAAKTPKTRAKIACARIEHLIKTGE